MCGIFLLLTDKPTEDLRVKLSENMARRGPDEFNYYSQQNILSYKTLVAAHSRLSITGIHSSLKQPVIRDKTLFMFNGEIYNYKFLIKKYELGNFAQSDTNVFWGLINKIGLEKTLKEIDSMYAFVYANFNSGEIFYGKDHFSQKPLYIFKDSDNFALISEPEYINHITEKKKLNYHFINKITQLGYKFRNDTNDTEIERLKTVAPNKIYKASFNCLKGSITSHDLYSRNYLLNSKSKKNEKTLTELVESIIPEEVKFGLPLSSGVDSNYLYEVIKKSKKLDNLIGVYTVSSNDERYSEAKYLDVIKAELQQIGVPFNHVKPPKGNQFLDILKKMVSQRLGLVLGLNYVGQYQLYEKMHQDGAKVSISGVGADELFSGYYDHYNLHYATQKEQIFLRKWEENIKPIVRNPWLQDINLFIKNPSERGHLLEDGENYSHLFKNQVDFPKIEENKKLSLLRRRMENELLKEIVPNVLRDDDFNSMKHSIENRSPFLQESVHYFSNMFTDNELFKDNIAKSVLRGFGEKLNPNNPAFRRYKKIGFNLSIWDLIGEEEKNINELIMSSKYVNENIDRDLFFEMTKKRDNSNYFSKLYFCMINISILENLNS